MAAQGSEQLGPSLVRTRVMVRARDGIQLATDIYTTTSLAQATPLPVIFERTPYGIRKTRDSDQDVPGQPIPTPEEQAARIVGRGYTYVRQECRGRGDSEGIFVKYLNETEDGADAIAWIAAQAWCDGRVATTGVSYSAHAQLAAAAENPAGLAAMLCDSGGFNSAFEAGVRYGGAFELKQLTWALRNAKVSPEAADPEVLAALNAIDIPAWFDARPWTAQHSPLAAAPAYEQFVLDQWADETLTDRWKAPAVYGRGFYDVMPDVPAMFISSWYDPYTRTAIEDFHAWQALKKSGGYLVLGPWTHGKRTRSYAGDVDFGPAATMSPALAPSYMDFRLDWFETVLAGSSATPVVRYFLMGGGDGSWIDGRLQHGGEWCEAAAWPPAEAVPTSWFFDETGELVLNAPETAGSVSLLVDPFHPVPTIGGQVTSGEPVMSGGAFVQQPNEHTHVLGPDRRPLDQRDDVAVFRTPVLAQDVVVAGPVTATIWLTSPALDTDVVVKLVDEYPPCEQYPEGFGINITEGILRGRFRRSLEEPTPLVPGEPMEFTFTLPDTANRFVAGHRLRIDVAGSDYPRFDVNPNTGAPAHDDGPRQVVTNQILIGGEHASRISLTCVPANTA